MTEHLLVGEFLLLFGHQACSGQSFLRVDTLEPPSVFWGRFLLHGRLQPRVGNSSLAGQRCPLLPWGRAGTQTTLALPSQKFQEMGTDHKTKQHRRALPAPGLWDSSRAHDVPRAHGYRATSAQQQQR